jgi:hypothetical protein
LGRHNGQSTVNGTEKSQLKSLNNPTLDLAMEDRSTRYSAVVVKIEVDDSSSFEQAGDGRPSSPQVGKSDAGQLDQHKIKMFTFFVF